MEIYIVVGMLCIIIGGVKIFQNILKKTRPYEILEGKVVEFKKHKSINGTTTKVAEYITPIFQYEYLERIYKIEHSISTSIKNNKKAEFQLGDIVELRVYTTTPDEAVVNSAWGVNNLLFVGLMFVVVGSVLILGGVLL